MTSHKTDRRWYRCAPRHRTKFLRWFRSKMRTEIVEAVEQREVKEYPAGHSPEEHALNVEDAIRHMWREGEG